MNNLQLALKELDEEWFASLPEFEDKPPFEVSKEFLKWEQRVIYGKKSVSSKVVKVILIAAALLIIFSVVALSTTKGREFVMHFFKDSAVYSLQAEWSQKVTSLKVNYMPENFKIDSELKEIEMIKQEYSFNNNWIIIEKHTIRTTLDFDYISNDFELIKYNGLEYIFSFVDNGICNVFWNYNGYYYQVSGNVDKETAMQIAFGVE